MKAAAKHAAKRAADKYEGEPVAPKKKARAKKPAKAAAKAGATSKTTQAAAAEHGDANQENTEQRPAPNRRAAARTWDEAMCAPNNHVLHVAIIWHFKWFALPGEARH